jgi:hypothetical protein
LAERNYIQDSNLPGNQDVGLLSKTITKLQEEKKAFPICLVKLHQPPSRKRKKVG